MYKKLKQVFIFIAIILITIISVRFVKTYQSEMFGGNREVIAVNQATLNLQDELQKIAKAKQVLIAKQIVVTPKNKTGQLINTYQKIGTGQLPKNLPEQTHTALIKRSPDTVVYVIIGKNLSAEQLVNLLNKTGNNTQVFKTNQQLIVLKQLVLVPQILLAIIVLIFSFIALLLADYIAAFKKIGILRLAGESTSHFVWKNTYHDLVSVAIAVGVALIGALAYLSWQSLFMTLFIEILLVSVGFFIALIVLAIAFVASTFSVLMTRQSINLLIKGKMPIRGFTAVIVTLQLLTILAAIYAVSTVATAQQSVTQVKQGQQEWRKNSQYYGLTAIQGEASGKDWQGFYQALLRDPNNLLIANNFDSIYASEYGTNGKAAIKNTNGYLPTAFADENMLFVSQSFLKKAHIQISSTLNQRLADLKQGQYGLLIPESQKQKQNQLTSIWGNYFQPSKVDIKAGNGIKMQQLSGLYHPTNTNIFAYPVYSAGGVQSSNQIYAQNPIIVVFGSQTFDEKHIGRLNQYIYQTLITNVSRTKQLVKKYHLELSIGAFANGYEEANQRLHTMQTKQTFLIGSTIVAIISSILLTYVLNVIYFYQNRRKFVIERLAGMKAQQIHATYLKVIVASSGLLVLLVWLMHLPLVSFLVPVIYLLLSGLIFVWQANQAKEQQVQYLKGE